MSLNTLLVEFRKGRETEDNDFDPNTVCSIYYYNPFKSQLPLSAKVVYNRSQNERVILSLF